VKQFAPAVVKQAWENTYCILYHCSVITSNRHSYIGVLRNRHEVATHYLKKFYCMVKKGLACTRSYIIIHTVVCSLDEMRKITIKCMGVCPGTLRPD